MAGEGVGRCILVGLHMDAVGKELLQWALNQAARSGDRVVAVHIYRKSGDLCKTNALTLIRTLDDYLAEYEAICSKKDVRKQASKHDDAFTAINVVGGCAHVLVLMAFLSVRSSSWGG